MATFLSLMAAGVLIVLIYIWSGESIVALIFSIISLFAVLALLQWRPWIIDGEKASAKSRQAATWRSAQSANPSSPKSSGATAWRCPFDITWDGRGISGVAMGSRAPQMWSWSQIDDIGHELYRAETNADDQVDRQPTPPEPDDRLAFRLDFPDLRNPEEPAQAWVRFGPKQVPETVAREARSAWRDSKIKRSRLFELSPQERTLKLADHVAPDRLDLTDWPRSPELLYQEVRRELLAGGELCRIPLDASFDEVLDAFDIMLETNRVDLITEAEADELLQSDGPQRVASLHRTLDWVAEQRGLRMAFIHQVAGRGSDDYLITLIPAASADDWDGQTVGGGSTTVMLDRPS